MSRHVAASTNVAFKRWLVNMKPRDHDDNATCPPPTTKLKLKIKKLKLYMG